MIPSTMPLVLLLVLSTTLFAQGRIEKIPTDWAAEELHRITMVEATASSTLGAAGGEYNAARAVDGNRGTKWVAAIAPNETAPQWITLKWIGTKRVGALALFGEAPDNDGVQNAQIQIAGTVPDSWTTVATVQDARSRNWLATFTPVKTSAVRLLVTRSGGPTNHTDVYEIELYGPPLTPEELNAHVHEQLDQCRSSVDKMKATVDRLILNELPHQEELIQVAGHLANTTKKPLVVSCAGERFRRSNTRSWPMKSNG